MNDDDHDDVVVDDDDVDDHDDGEQLLLAPEGMDYDVHPFMEAWNPKPGPALGRCPRGPRIRSTQHIVLTARLRESTSPRWPRLQQPLLARRHLL